MRLSKFFAVATAVIAIPGVVIATPRSAGLDVRDPVIHPGPQGGTTAAYMTVINTTARPLKLTSFACACAEMTMAHQSSEVGGMAHMSPAGDLIVPPHGELKFATGGLHLMVMGLKHGLRLGEHTPITLSLDRGPPIAVDFAVGR